MKMSKKKKNFNSPKPNLQNHKKIEEKRRKRLESRGLVHEWLEISNEFEFDDANESEVNEPPNATLIDFDDCLMNDVGHVAANNDNNVV